MIRILIFIIFLWGDLWAQDSISLELLPVEIRVERIYSPSKIGLSRSQFLSSPASFDDPSRLLMKYPGFSISNDQNNAIIYNGLPSHYSTWSLYGAQITNPNHLSNAGTANDRSSRSSGGVNMFSGQVIGGLNYYTGNEGPAHGVGGVADISIRSPYQNTVTTNLSLIGLEAGIDRMFDDGNSSFLANYRYSTVGLLSEMGVDFGGEVITYQDVLAEYKTKLKNQELRITASYGNSSNNFEKQFLQSDTAAVFKDIQDIELEAENVATAITIGAENHRLTLAYSSRSEEKQNRYIWNELPENSMSRLNEKILSLYAFKTWSTNRLDYTLDVNANRYSYDILDINSSDSNSIILGGYIKTIEFEESYLEIRPRATLKWSLTERQKLSIGTGAYSQSYNEEFHFLPFLSYTGEFKSFSTLLSIQNDRQSASPELLGMRGFDGNSSFNNSSLKSINSWSFKMGVSKSNHGVLVFGNKIFDTPYNYLTGLSGLSELGQLPIQRYESVNEVFVKGAKAYTSFDFKGYGMHANYTIMESIMEQAMNRSLPLDFQNLLNLKLDKSVKLSDKKSLRIVTSFHFRNGFRRLGIDRNSSKLRLQTVYDGYTSNLENYQRVDLRLSYVKKGKWKNVFSLDIQNVLNRQNEGFYYFDPLQDEVVLQKQLGLIPILSWRLII